MPFLLSSMHWLRPWAWLLMPLCLLPWWLRWRAARVVEGYAEPALRPWALLPPLQRSSLWLESIVWLLLLASLAGPSWPRAQVETGRGRHVMSLMVVIGADDIAHAQRAADALRQLLPRLHGERVGLLVWRASPGLLLPCTDDDAAVVRELDRYDPAQLPASPRLDPAAALALARQQLLASAGTSHALLWLQVQQQAALTPMLRQQVQRLRQSHIPLFVLDLSPSAADPGWKALAESDGGRYLADAASPWDTLYADGIERLPAEPLPSAAEWTDGYGWPLLAALLLWLSTQALPMLGRWRWPLLLTSLLLAAWWLPGLALSAQASSQQAWQAWQASDWARAQRLWAVVPGYAARIGEGASAYRQRHWTQAATAFREAVLDADDDGARASALYNLGNAAFHTPDGLRLALDAYAASLALRPDDANALRNARLAQAQWDEEHPAAEISAMRKRAPEVDHSRFGIDDDLTPSQWQAPTDQAVHARASEELARGGKLQGMGGTRPVTSKAPWIDGIDPEAAWRKADLLDDHAVELQNALFAADAAAAQQLLQEGR